LFSTVRSTSSRSALIEGLLYRVAIAVRLRSRISTCRLVKSRFVC
jgi:hypothetical protein